MGYIFLIITSLNLNADILSDIFNYQSDYDTEETEQYTAPNNSEPEHYSWDNLYLPTYPEPEEIIVNPYE
jgi:hypothetical protein